MKLKNKIIVGIDECGRGAIAGPMVSPAVCLEGTNCGIKDSKKMTPKQRNTMYWWLMSHAKWSIGIVNPEDIDDMGLSLGWNFCVGEAFNSLRHSIPYKDDHLDIKIDGNIIPRSLEYFNTESIVKGDSKIKEISAASIIAKVWRDNYMINASEAYPQYKWSKNKGYPTREHIRAIKEHGLSPLHRHRWCEKWI